MTPSTPDALAHVVIAGGGFAGVETLLALRAMADDRLPVTLVSPGPHFQYRPAATVEAFEDEPVVSYPLVEIAADLGATLQRARLESVGAERQYVRLSSGGRLRYDHLVLALGTRARARIPGALTFRDQRDLPLLSSLLQDLRAGQLRHIVFALPPAPSYPVPLYELAMLTAGEISTHGVDAAVTIASPERAPLAVFGEKASLLVGELLHERGVRFSGGVVPVEVDRSGALVLASGATVEADRVVAVPQLRGQRITGVPSNAAGFIPTDADGQVEGLPNVYAAGDITAFPIKQAGLATQQADRIVQRILEDAGIAAPHVRRARILQAHLIGGEQPLLLRAELDDQGRATSASLGHAIDGDDIAHDKVFARYLTPYLKSFRERAAAALV